MSDKARKDGTGWSSSRVVEIGIVFLLVDQVVLVCSEGRRRTGLGLYTVYCILYPKVNAEMPVLIVYSYTRVRVSCI